MHSRRDRKCHKSILSVVFNTQCEQKTVKSGIKVNHMTTPKNEAAHAWVGAR